MLQQRWNNATARERLLVIVMVLVVICAALIALLVRPAWRLVQSAPATLNALEASVLTMRTQAAQLRTASVAATAVASPLPSVERELAGPGATVAEVRDTASAGQTSITVNLKSVESTRLAAWLEHPGVLRHMQRLNVTRDPATGRISGTAVLRAPSL